MKYLAIGIVAIFSFCIVGCKNTVEGAQVDSRTNAINASATLKEGIDNGANMAKNIGEDAKEASKNLGAAAELTPRIKNAINADSNLNSNGNLIDVDTTKEKVVLNGHVNSRKLKELAGNLAHEEMKKAQADQKLVNNLEVIVPAKK